MQSIEQGYMAFFREGSEGIGAVTDVSNDEVVVYVENFGPFTVPMSAVREVHDSKVILEKDRVSSMFLKAVAHAHDAEDPKTAG
ncbi:MAG: hypothetical protein KDJ17_12955 [Hyphomicrobiaceae bacterium]|nr:hypothetical protein [Hyphomicrobiaceae bacterium]